MLFPQDRHYFEDEEAPGRYLRLDLFIKVLSLLCPNLTDAFLFLLFAEASVD